MQKGEPAILELSCSRAHRLRIGQLELDRRLRHRKMGRPLGLLEAGLGGLAQRPDPEVPGAGERLAVPVLRALASRQREAERVDIELAALRRIGGDDRDRSDEDDVHTNIQPVLANAVLHETDAALEITPEPTGEAGPVGIATNVGVSAVQRVDAGRDESDHRGKRRHTRCCAVEDEDREDRKHRDQREEDASPDS